MILYCNMGAFLYASKTTADVIFFLLNDVCMNFPFYRQVAKMYTLSTLDTFFYFIFPPITVIARLVDDAQKFLGCDVVL
jgi:hypothetical protein